MKQLIQGNEAISKAAIKVGLGFYSGYPITPASEIMHYLAKENIVFMHVEDEIAAINMAIGASLAGRKAMTATSGPGFSLMQEGIGLGHMLQVPIVIVNNQRVGPSTGMPTLPNQGDVMQARYGSHGDYNPIVFYPNSVEELYKYTIEAFNAADESLSPVILLNDQFLAHMYETINIPDVKIKNRNLKPLGTGKRHFTGLLAKNGIPKTKDYKYYREFIRKLNNKNKEIAKNYEFYEYIENKKADTLLIAYGFTSRVILSLKDKYSIFRPIRLFPIIEKLKDISSKYKRIVIIEMNEGQYKKEVEALLKRDVKLIKAHVYPSLEEIKNELER